MKSSILHLVYVLVFFYITLSIISVEARKSHGHSHKHSHSHKTKSSAHKHHHKPRNHANDTSSSSGSSCSPPSPTSSHVFSVSSFGAKGDGITDDSQAFVAAWKAACTVPEATVEIPSGFKFLVKPITLQGPCMPHLVLQIDGTIIAPPQVSSWPKSGLFQWINFKWIQNFTIQGYGVVDGQGSEWWSSYSPMRKNNVPGMKPTALRFYASNNVIVRDIRITNSPLCHLKFDNSRGVMIDNITISSPESSLNTDGIHLQNSRDVEIQHSNIGTGDDCISIQTGCSNVNIHHINCGPGHGISLGGLGKDKNPACVSNIIVEDIFMQDTMYGARIKTWQGGIGLVKNVTFSNIEMSNVRVPVMIDQFYCDKMHCKNQTGGVAISDVKFNQITGTYSATPVQLACNNDVPCVNVDLIGIQLNPVPGKRFGFQQAVCLNSYGKSKGPLSPSSIDDCVRIGSDLVRRVERSHERVCQQGH